MKKRVDINLNQYCNYDSKDFLRYLYNENKKRKSDEGKILILKIKLISKRHYHLNQQMVFSLYFVNFVKINLI